MVVLSDDTVVVCGDEGIGGHKYRVKRYNLQTGRELTSIDLQSSVEGLAEVELRGDPTLALVYRSVFLKILLRFFLIQFLEKYMTAKLLYYKTEYTLRRND